MKEYASGIQSSELGLVDAPAPGSDAPRSAEVRPPKLGRVGSAAPPGDALSVADLLAPDLSLVIDVPAVPEEAPAYSHPDAVGLHGAGPTQHAESPARRAKASQRIFDANAHAAVRDIRTPRQRALTDHGRARSNRRKLTLVAGAVGFVVAVVVGLVAMRSESVPAQQINVAKATPRNVTSGASTSSSRATSPAANARRSLVEDTSGEDFAATLQALKGAGNWNVFVVYAGEWTRAQPGNADAWRELSIGYVKLRQLRDALDAATKAVQLAPNSFLAWQTLGKIDVALQDTSGALAAFERASALNDQDVVSLVQAGTLNTRLGRVTEARIAFAKALAMSPEDVDALCGAASVAQKEGRLKDAEAMVQQVKSLDGICRDSATVESVRVVVNGSAKSNTAASSGR